MNIQDLYKGLSALPDTPLMPVIFVGHGTPMNALEDNIFTKSWVDSLKMIPSPRLLFVYQLIEKRGVRM